MKPPLQQGNSNDFQTPAWAIQPLLPFIKKEWLIWECACGKGNIVNAFKEHKYNIIGSDLLNDKDFLSNSLYTYLPEKYDCIITNPPYSIKQKFLERAYELKKPFAFLLPLTTFETQKRQKLFKEYGLEVIFFDKRINFETPSGTGSGAWFATAWFTNWLNIGKELNYYCGA